MSVGQSSAAIPNAPTIGTATAGSGSATVEYTAAILGATATSFTATSNPGSITGTGSSPITVSGLTDDTSYTFTVTATNANGTSGPSAVSNSVTPTTPAYYNSISTANVVSNGTAYVEFTSIPQTYKHLQLRVYGLSNASQEAIPGIQFGSGSNSPDTGNNYIASRFLGYDTNQFSVINFGLMSAIYLYPLVGNSTQPGSGIIDILEYTNTNFYKTVKSTGMVYASNRNAVCGGLWNNTGAITYIKIFLDGNTFNANTKIALYGIKG